MDPTYQMLRYLTSPVVAITSSAQGRRTGQIVNSAQRASLVPTVPRVSMYISKTNASHDLIYASGVFGMHLLRTDQWALIWRLGLQSARDVPDKLAGLETHVGETGCPLLVDVLAGLECRVINTMDTGVSTFFLGDVVSVHPGREGSLMTSEYFRANMNADKKVIYERLLRAAQNELESMARNVDPERTWPGPAVRP
ncbi:MAG: flavin reductase [Gammaproteobacteria bacterium]|nr:flavin reductase [Gammaproteobacteria bacterium]